MQYLITGGEGFIGSGITKAIDGISYDLKSGQNILDQATLDQAVAGKKGIFHCAAKISVPESFEIPAEYYENNVIGTCCVIKAAEKTKSKIVFSSSAAVYGDSNGEKDSKASGEASNKATEDATLNPKSPYAQNKADGEALLRASNIPHIVLRYFNIYGPGQSPQYAGVITFFILNALKGEDLIIFGDGNHVRDFVFISDVVQANITAMEYDNQAFEIFNIGSGVETSIRFLAETIIRLTNSSSKIVHKPKREGDIVYSQADISKAKNILKWESEVSLEEGLKQTIEYYRKK